MSEGERERKEFSKWHIIKLQINLQRNNFRYLLQKLMLILKFSSSYFMKYSYIFLITEVLLLLTGGST
jgi:hypothetical protein